MANHHNDVFQQAMGDKKLPDDISPRQQAYLDLMYHLRECPSEPYSEHLIEVDRELAQAPGFIYQLLIDILECIMPSEGDDTRSLADYLEEEGEKRGIERGLAEGRLAVKRESALRMLQHRVAPMFIAQNLDLPLEDVKDLKCELKQHG